VNNIKIVYVDDKPDPDISRYLAREYESVDFIKEYFEITFNSDEGYESLLSNPLIIEANIILIDSKLFENESVGVSKFSGEEFKMILKKMYPFIEVLVITQNELEEDFGTIQKYRHDNKETGIMYYSVKLKAALDNAYENISVFRNIANKLKRNEGIDKVLIEKILSSLDGSSQYDELTTKDIDSIISAFRELQRDIDV